MEQREVRLRKVEKNVSQGQISLIFFFLINCKIILITCYLFIYEWWSEDNLEKLAFSFYHVGPGT